jgi:hypothetical protein
MTGTTLYAIYNVIAKRWRIRCVTKLMRFKPAMCY